MKLLIIYHAGLVEDSKNIFREYARRGVDVTVIVPSVFCSSTGRCFNYSSSDDEKTYRFIPLPFHGWFSFFPFFNAIKKIKPDVIQVFDEYTSMYLTETIWCRNVLFGKKVPVFAYAFQNIPFSSPPFIKEVSIGSFKRIAYKILLPFIFWYHKSNVAGVSGSNNQALLNVKSVSKNIPTKRIFWGVDTKKFFPKNHDLSRKELGISKEVMLIGYFGRLIEEKGLDTLILAANKIDNCQVLFVGDGDYKNNLVSLIDSLGMKNNVFFYKGVDQVRLVDFYNTLDVFVLPSKTMSQWKEQYGRVLVEAMACGLPVVGSSSGAIPEVLEGYSKGFIFNEGDVEDLVKKILEANRLKSPEKITTDNFLHTFSVEHFVLEHLSFYKKILQQ